MNPRTRRAKRLRRQRARRVRAVRSYIRRMMVAALDAPRQRVVDVTPLPGFIRTQVDTQTGEVFGQLAKPLSYVHLSIELPPPVAAAPESPT